MSLRKLHPINNVFDGKFNTYTGKVFDLLNPQESQIDILDIAHSFGNICRWQGHCPQFYSDAQHSVMCVMLATSKLKELNIPKEHVSYFLLAVLLHDAHEAYTGDVIKPLKVLLHDYDKIAKPIQKCIYASYQLADIVATYACTIKNIDIAIGDIEFECFYEKKSERFLNIMQQFSSNEKYMCWSPQEAKHKFLAVYNDIIKSIAYEAPQQSA